jgi:hypothetical protein
MNRAWLLGVLTLGWIGCSDDTQAPTPDKGTVADKSTTTGDKGTTTGDKGTTADKGTTTVDKGTTTADQGSATPKILASTHTGWQKTNCATAGCHTLPVKGHTTSDKSECAKCHGGNGACNPNGPGSNKKDHTSTMSCAGGCHGSSKHGFTKATECQSCHFAAKGTTDC